jgi:hypothetical protein
MGAKIWVDPESGCWLYNGTINPETGYAQVYVGGSRHIDTGHHALYVLLRGPVRACRRVAA